MDIRAMTEEYWRKCEVNYYDALLKYYVGAEPFKQGLPPTQLLKRELEYARNNDASRLPELSCEYLLLIVGHSLEPLLQSIAVYKPDNVCLLINQSYGPQMTGSAIFNNINAILTSSDYKTIIGGKDISISSNIISNAASVDDFPCLDTTQAVFQELLRVTRALPLKSLKKSKTEQRYPLIIDITGGKKNMVAGAYLFGAYTGAALSYVDFDEYNPKQGRPYGYTCRVDIQSNPMEAFALKDWERLKELYNKYRFSECQIILDGIRGAMKAAELMLPEWDEAMSKLDRQLELYALWDNGNFRQAKDKAKKIPGLHVPAVVEVLGEHWPASKKKDGLMSELKELEYGTKSYGGKCFYENASLIYLYAADEYAKAERLSSKKEDYRSALLRAHGLSEFLLRARVIHLLAEHHALEFTPQGEVNPIHLSPINSQYYNDVYHGLVSAMLNPVVKLLKNRVAEITKSHKKELLGMAKIKEFPRNFDPKKVNKLIEDLRGYGDIRNKTIHTCLPCSQEIATDVLKAAKENLNDFRAVFVPSDGISTECDVNALEWKDLCKQCGITFLPPGL